jgi:hypothetical protein
MAKCPHCKKDVGAVTVETMMAFAGDVARTLVSVYACRSCEAVLGVGVDPLKLKDARGAGCRRRSAAG